jgi:glycosyltransferase involved in cell wall biosynthesis/peptidoglycan/xylan/chitin deacetylase (PgdA/CDA1 family)
MAIDLSVVVPYVGIGSIEPLLRSLAAQSLPEERWELIVVDQSGREDLLFPNGNGTHARRIVVPRSRRFRGHTAPLLRNEGARQSSGRWLVFIDADCVVNPDCLRNHLELQCAATDLQSPLAVCGGMRELPADKLSLVNSETSLAYKRIRSASLADYRSGRTENSARWDDFYSLNVSVPREFFEQSGGFDETGFRCHDIEFGYRLERLGARFTYAPQCEVIHIEHPRVAASRLEQAEAWRRLGNAHPELKILANDRIIISQRAFERAVRIADERFTGLTRELPGLRIGTVWLCPAGTGLPDVEQILRQVPFVRRDCRSTAQFFLRLDRNCWDFSVIVPSAVKPRLTVAIPAFNAVRTISRTIRSILAQTLQEIEVIVVDDASTDETAAVAREFAFDGRVRVISLLENGGAAVALNRALDAAEAPFLMHVDADDWLERTAVEEIVDVLEADVRIAAVYANAIMHMPDGEVSYVVASPVSTAAEMFAHLMPQVPRAYRVSALKSAGGWTTDDPAGGRYYEDRLTLARMLGFGAVRHLDAWLYNVRRGDDTLSCHADARLAKFAILSTEANRLGCSVSVHATRKVLRTDMVTRRAAREPGPWSVIIPVRNRAALVSLTLRSWLESDWAASGSELILVDDASDDKPEIPIRLGERIRIIRGDVQRGPAWARNAGAGSARHDMLLFADADHIVPPDILAVHRWYHDRDPAAAIVVGGVFGRRAFSCFQPEDIAPAQLRRFLSVIANHDRFAAIAAQIATRRYVDVIGDAADLWHALAAFTFVDRGSLRWSDFILRYGPGLTAYRHAWTRVGGANLSISAARFAALGRFNESLGSAEDWDLGARAQRTGFRIEMAVEAETYHQVHARERTEEIEAEGRRIFGERHPDLVQNLLSEHPRERPPGVEEFFLSNHERAAASSPNGALPPIVAVTFDDGPHCASTAAAIATLRRHGARATFFITGQNGQRHPALLSDIASDGHEVGVHGWYHTDPREMTTSEVARDFSRTIELVQRITGVTPTYVRPPYGEMSSSVMAAATSLNLKPVLWHISPRDWSQDGWRAQVRRLAVAGIRGKVVLLHDAAIEPDDMVRTLDWLLTAAREAGLRVVTLSEYEHEAELPLSVTSDRCA